MTRIDTLPPDLVANLGDRDIIVFDGVCVLCSGFFKVMMARDTTERFTFVLAQSDLGERLFTALDLPTREFETNIVIVDGAIYTRLDAFAAAMSALSGPMRVLRVVGWLPKWIKDPMYKMIARNRYRIWGRRDTCMLPTDKIRQRFLGAVAPPETS